MREEPLPQIKTLKSSNFDEVVHEVKSIAGIAKNNHTHHLVLVSGVPGAGKTFVGLTLAHDIEKAVYLSGNGPLVDVLQDSLQNKTFVQALYGYKTDYIRYGKVPDEHVIIFDEAQRAWDSKKMNGVKSEPDIIIEIAKHKSWSVVVGLIGEGQEIHIGEEGGIGLWNAAIRNHDIHVHAKHHQTIFPNAKHYYENKNLHLNTSLRTHNALKYFEWVEEFIAGHFERCKEIQQQLEKERFMLKFVKSLDEAKALVQNLYEGTDKTYGIVISSGLKNPKGVKVVPFSDRYTTPKHHVAYFNYPDSPYYCRKLDYAATEFQVQGLELDMSIVYWGSDLQWKNGEWKASNHKQGAEDPYQMKLNAYRVLLTRGRDGVIICY
ncbi:DNA/RNA helicase domain-containing protein [Neobacillus drentensis]|uniref:DNA/RNA helicase domain-containing protein n=1 Tax=Neobacillus drentensis TaxID=220684 RepID=UPI003000523F